MRGATTGSHPANQRAACGPRPAPAGGRGPAGSRGGAAGPALPGAEMCANVRLSPCRAHLDQLPPATRGPRLRRTAPAKGCHARHPRVRPTAGLTWEQPATPAPSPVSGSGEGPPALRTAPPTPRSSWPGQKTGTRPLHQQTRGDCVLSPWTVDFHHQLPLCLGKQSHLPWDVLLGNQELGSERRGVV